MSTRLTFREPNARRTVSVGRQDEHKWFIGKVGTYPCTLFHAGYSFVTGFEENGKSSQWTGGIVIDNAQECDVEIIVTPRA